MKKISLHVTHTSLSMIHLLIIMELIVLPLVMIDAKWMRNIAKVSLQERVVNTPSAIRSSTRVSTANCFKM
jgi:hypothetical protein